MTTPTKHDAIWTAIYAAAFVRETHDAIARGRGWDDEGVDHAREEAEGCADWELERRLAGYETVRRGLPTSHVALHEALLARTPEDRVRHLAAGHLVTGRAFGKGDALETMKRLIEEQHRADISKAVVESTLCRAQSPSSGDDDPPVTCSRERGHDGQHEGGCRGGTASWDSTEEPAPVNCGSCHTCLDGLAKMTMMVLCITCGNKRCPRANDHNNECSGSNSPGQKGSAYE